MGLCGSSEFICKNNRKNRKQTFPKGEHFFLKNVIIDNNISTNNLKKNINYFFL